MSDKRAYSYVVLRYVHDVLTGEFINIGVLLYAPSVEGSPPYVKARVRRTIGRLKAAFPDLDRDAFVRSVRAVERSIERTAETVRKGGLFQDRGDAAGIAIRALPIDDSSFQWSSVSTGLTHDPEKTFSRVFGRLVSGYDTKAFTRRSDDEIWRPVRARLDELDVPVELHEKTIRSEVDQIDFRHAWKNGRWHVYEPLSFDLADGDNIKDKARRWLGHLSAVAKHPDEVFQPYFIVGAPADGALMPAYRNALQILRSAPLDPKIYEEGQIEEFVAMVEDEVRAHSHR